MKPQVENASSLINGYCIKAVKAYWKR